MTSLRHNDVPDPQSAYLDAARACILDVGWRRTTLTEVARRAGVSRMTIYRAWPDMPAVLADLMTREWGEVVTRAVEAADAALPGRPTAADRLVAEVVATTRALRDNELFVRIVELDAELSRVVRRAVELCPAAGSGPGSTSCRATSTSS